MKKLIYTAVMALMLASCGIWGKYNSETKVPENAFGQEAAQYMDGSNKADSMNVSMGAISWRYVFTDAKLQALIETALANNKDLLVAHENVVQSEAALKSARLAYLPSLVLGSASTPSVTWTAGGKWDYNTNLYATWQLDFFGQISNRKWAAKATKQQMEDMEQACRASLIAQVANCYYALLMLDAQLEVVNQSKENWSKTVEVVYYLKEAGITTEAGAAQLEANYFDICTQVKNLEAEQNKVRNQLCVLIGQAPGEISRGKLYEQTFPETFSVGLPASTLLSRPDVKAAERGLEAAYYNLHASRSDFFPNIILGGTAGWKNEKEGVFDSPSKFITAAAGALVASLFDAGKQRAANEIASSKQTQARLMLEQTMLNAGSEVNSLIVEFQTRLDNIKSFEKEVESLSRARESTEYLMKYGTTTYLEVLTAQNTLLAAQVNQIANKAGLLQTVSSLYQALGGGGSQE